MFSCFFSRKSIKKSWFVWFVCSRCVYFTLHLFPRSLLRKGPPLKKVSLRTPPFPSATALHSLPLSAFNLWLETAGVALSGQPWPIRGAESDRKRGDASKDCRGNVYFAIGKKTGSLRRLLLLLFFPPLATITFKYLHINDSPVAVKEEMQRGRRGRWQMKMKCHECKVQARWGGRWSRFICLWGNALRMWGKCHRGRDISPAAGATQQKILIFSATLNPWIILSFQKTRSHYVADFTLDSSNWSTESWVRCFVLPATLIRAKYPDLIFRFCSTPDSSLNVPLRSIRVASHFLFVAVPSHQQYMAFNLSPTIWRRECSYSGSNPTSCVCVCKRERTLTCRWPWLITLLADDSFSFSTCWKVLQSCR